MPMTYRSTKNKNKNKKTEDKPQQQRVYMMEIVTHIVMPIAMFIVTL